MTPFLRLNLSPISPLLLFPLVWGVSALLASLQLPPTQTVWSSNMFLVVLITPLAFFFGGLVGSVAGFSVTASSQIRLPRLSLRGTKLVLTILVLIGYAELLHQFTRIGGVPLLSPNGNLLRFEQGGPSIILTNFLTVACLLALTLPRSLSNRESTFFLAIGGISFLGYALQGGRGMLVLLIVATLFSRWIFWGRPNIALIFGGFLATLVLSSLVFFIRSRESPYLPFESSLYGDLLPDVPFFLLPLVPIYIAISTNFKALEGLVSYFPAQGAFGGGIYNLAGFDLFIDSATGISSVSAEITPPWVTSTIAGALWGDGGFLWVIVGLFLIGFTACLLFVAARRTEGLGWSAAAGYSLYLVLFGLYTNLWTQQVDWLMVIPLLLLLGSIFPQLPLTTSGERPPSSSSLS